MTSRGGSHRPAWRFALAAVAAIFGAATLVSGGRVLFGSDAARAAAGAYVPFVVWFNFLAGFAYLVAAAGIALARRWAGALSLGIAAATLLACLAFAAHVLAGGAHETRTVVALAIRLTTWVAIGLVVSRWPGRGAAGAATT
ncbi:MAG: hypothetical protein IPO09_06690 [Anaeromyxobacter sp.]|nr:hypothetical protein [Anaeromyxobacter sp.]MBL0277354.1 hypothetical protein [Anaeromyxobacter sp.]